MLYSKEKLLFNNLERDVYLYLKRTRNHSYRITANKISLTLPQIYKLPETIEIHKKALIQKVKERISENPELIPSTRLLEDECIQIYTDKYLIIRDNTPIKFDFNKSKSAIQMSADEEKNISKLTRKIIENYSISIEQRVRYINKITVNKIIQRVELKNNHSTWGLCSSKGEITISVNTLFAPMWALDYVIVHELCHLVHHDHSAKFWDLVERFYPKYKLAKKYLKEKGLELIL
jgi:predicted metal-dependent hydrolase